LIAHFALRANIGIMQSVFSLKTVLRVNVIANMSLFAALYDWQLANKSVAIAT